MKSNYINNQIFLKVKDHLVSGETFDLIQPYEFDYLVTQPVPEAEKLEKYYQTEDYVSHNDAATGFIHKLYRMVKRWNLSIKHNSIRKFLKSEDQLLDIGAGTGDFVQYCLTKDNLAFGVEPNQTAREQANKKDVSLSADYSSFKENQFKLISLWHVLEHIPNLVEAISLQHKLLRKNGFVVVALPNYKSFDANLFKSYWAAYDVPRHIHHFSPKAISFFYEKHNFRLVESKAMWFDAFYISILSAKYKKWPLSFLVGIFVGALSNLWAVFTRQTSSRIYIFQKL